MIAAFVGGTLSTAPMARSMSDRSFGRMALGLLPLVAFALYSPVTAVGGRRALSEMVAE